MNRFLISLFAVCLSIPVSGWAQTAFTTQSQCDPNTSSYIQCGYFDEGFRDGTGDAQNNRSNDYKRYKDKIDGKRYEDFYRRGYDAGYNSIRPFARWDSSQKSTYDQGYRDGENDRRKNISRLPERYEGQYNRSLEQYYRAGYLDGYDNKGKQYDRPLDASVAGPAFPPTTVNQPVNTPVNTGTTNPWSTPGTNSGSISWSGQVDNKVNIVIQGNTIQNQIVAGTLREGYKNMNGVLPRRPITLFVNKTEGRGTASVIQQPDRSNNYTGIVQVEDSKRGSDDYKLDISWSSGGVTVEEPYEAGRVTWSGRVDQTANIIISGRDVRSEDASATGLRDVRFNISGYLARRPGTITANKIKGRGTVIVSQQPSFENDYTAIVRVIDTEKGDGEYQVEISW